MSRASLSIPVKEMFPSGDMCLNSEGGDFRNTICHHSNQYGLLFNLFYHRKILIEPFFFKIFQRFSFQLATKLKLQYLLTWYPDTRMCVPLGNFLFNFRLSTHVTTFTRSKKRPSLHKKCLEIAMPSSNYDKMKYESNKNHTTIEEKTPTVRSVEQ